MQSSKPILFFEKCRLCLENAGVTNILDAEELQADIFACTGVKISEAESLPSKICPDCLEIIQKAKELRNKAVRNDVHLRSLFSDDEDTLVIDERQSNVNNIKVEPECLNGLNQNLNVPKDLFDPPSCSTPELKSKKRSRIKIVYEDSNENRCKLCGKDFDTYKKLYLHMRLHNKKHPCPIDVCGKKFSTKGDLEKHLRTHTGVKPYTCEICDKSFAQQVTLRTHKETVHHIFSHVTDFKVGKTGHKLSDTSVSRG